MSDQASDTSSLRQGQQKMRQSLLLNELEIHKSKIIEESFFQSQDEPSQYKLQNRLDTFEEHPKDLSQIQQQNLTFDYSNQLENEMISPNVKRYAVSQYEEKQASPFSSFIRQPQEKVEQLKYEDQQDFIGETQINILQNNPKEINIPAQKDQQKEMEEKGSPKQRIPSKQVNKISKLLESKISIIPDEPQHQVSTKTNQLLVRIQFIRRFINKLKARSKNILFRNITNNQFGIINDISAEYGYYIYEENMIQSKVYLFLFLHLLIYAKVQFNL